MARQLPVRQKDPATSRVVTFDFTEDLASGDNLMGAATVTAVGLTAAAVVASPLVRVRLTGGEDGADVVVKCVVQTESLNYVAMSMLLEIREGAN